MPAKRIIGLVIGVAVLIRVVAALALGDNALPLSGAYDQVSYDMLAQRVLAGKGFSFPSPWYPFTAPDEATAHWSFLYALYLAGVYALFGHHPLAARLIQVLISGLSIWLTYRLGRRLFGEIVALAAAALTAAYAYFVFFNAALMTQTFYIIALLAALNVALILSDNSRLTLGTWNLKPATWAFLGLALGLGALFRQTSLLFTPILLAWVWWAQRPQDNTGKREHGERDNLTRSPSHLVSLSRFLLPLAVIAILILPWTIRNYLVYHDFLLLNSNSGFWFYSSNHPSQGTNFDPTYVAPIPDELKGLPEPALDRALLREAVRFVVSDPVRFVLLSINRTKDYFWLVPSEQSSLISNASRLLSFTLYLPFMIYGLYLSRKNWRACLPLYLYAAFDTGLCLITWSAPRYRLPTDALMMVFAGLAVVDLAERLGISRWLSERFPVRNLQSES